jgi:hypothetical protein
MIAALLLPLPAAFVVVEHALDRSCRLGLRLILAALLAVAASSGVLFLYVLLRGSMAGYGTFDTSCWLLLDALAVVCWLRTRRLPREAPASVPPSSPLAIVLRIWLIFDLAIALGQFLDTVSRLPSGKFDAWAIWNLRGRFLLRAVDWKDAVHPAMSYSHVDYPLLLPATIARAWSLSGGSSPWGPVLVAGFFTLAAVLVVTMAVASLKGATQGYLAGIVLCLGPVPNQGTRLYADVPVSCYFAASAALLALAARAPSREHRLLTLAGAFVGAAAWTKNEGALFAVVALSMWSLFVLRARGWRALAASGRSLIGGMAFFLVILALLKHAAGTGNDLLASYGRSAGMLLTDSTRYLAILDVFREHARSGLAWMLGAAGVFLIVAPRREQRVALALPLCALPAAMLIGYFFAFVTTPYDLAWHLGTAADRLFVQLLPVAVLAFFLVAPTLEDVAARVSLPD